MQEKYIKNKKNENGCRRVLKKGVYILWKFFIKNGSSYDMTFY